MKSDISVKYRQTDRSTDFITVGLWGSHTIVVTNVAGSTDGQNRSVNTKLST